MSQGIERNQPTSIGIEGDLQSLAQKGREPIFVDMVYCIIPPEGAVSGEWELGECEFFSETHEALG